MTDGKIFNVLFLCTGNSARSILAEAIMNSLGKGKFRAYSAGSHPSGRVHPLALDTLRIAGLSTEGARSKAWDEFAEPGAPKMDFIFTVCDNAAGEVCPIWPGHPMTAHWGVEDPAAFEGTEAEKRAVFLKVFRMLQNRISVFASLPVASLDRQSLQNRINEIGRMGDEAQPASPI
ncbi:MAG: arsenate reductase ArsC [Rhodospirillales bacterium]|nr:arsenate reductase ArsC [Rhodospirillales bacterium]